MKRRFAATSILTAAILAGTTLQALAYPGNGDGQATFPMICDGELVTLTIGGGNWSAAYVHETGGRFIPTATSFEMIDLATAELVYREVDEKTSDEIESSSDDADAIDDFFPTTCVDAWLDGGYLYVFEVQGKLR